MIPNKHITIWPRAREGVPKGKFGIEGDGNCNFLRLGTRYIPFGPWWLICISAVLLPIPLFALWLLLLCRILRWRAGRRTRLPWDIALMGLAGRFLLRLYRTPHRFWLWYFYEAEYARWKRGERPFGAFPAPATGAK